MQIQVLWFNRLRITSALVASLVLIGGCGNGQQPVVTNPSPTVASLNLLGPDFLRIGESADFSIEAVYSDGTRGPMTAQMWECDNPNVAGIAGGRGTGLAPGRAKLYGRCQHGRAEHAIRVVPDYRGSWAGSYVWRSCTASGQFQQERACDVFSPGTQLPLSLRLSQDKDLTTGTIAFGDLMGDVTGVIDDPGHVAMSGSMRYDAEGVTVVITLAEWDTMASGDRMSGRFRQVWTIAGASGNMTADCDAISLARTSQGARTVDARGIAAARSLRDLLIRLRAR